MSFVTKVVSTGGFHVNTRKQTELQLTETPQSLARARGTVALVAFAAFSLVLLNPIFRIQKACHGFSADGEPLGVTTGT